MGAFSGRRLFGSLLREAAGLLAELAPRHGISAVQLGADPAELVVTLEQGRTYFDLAELEAEAVRRAVTQGGREAFDASEDRGRALASSWVGERAAP